MTASIRDYQVGLTTGNQTSITVNKPTGTVSGDQLVLYLCKDGSDTVTTPPTGFTYQSSLSAVIGATCEMRTFTRTADGTEGSTFSLSWAGSETAVLYAIAIKDTAGIDVSGAVASAGNSTSETVSALTTTVDDTFLLGLAGSEDGSGNISSSSGFTEVVETSNGAGVTGALATIYTKAGPATAGSTGAMTFTQSTTQELQIAVIAFKPAAGGDVTANPTGNAGTGAAGTVTVTGDANVTPTGVAGTGSAGDVTITLLLNVPVTGVAGSGSAGDVTVAGDANVTLTGVTATGSAGNPTVTGDANVTLTGTEATGAAGDVTVSITGDVSIDITGVEASGAVGTPAATGDANVDIIGVSGAGAAGDLTVTADANASVSGVEATGESGDVSVTITGDVDVFIDGVEAVGQAGDVDVTAEDNANQPAGKRSRGDSPYPKKYLFRDEIVWVRDAEEERELGEAFLADLRAEQERNKPKSKKLKKSQAKRLLRVTAKALEETKSQAAEPDYSALLEAWIAEQAAQAANDDNEAILLLMAA